MRILHTEASLGWGGQEIRIVNEALGMRERGHTLFFAVQKGGRIVLPLREAGFEVYECTFSKKSALTTFIKLAKLIFSKKIDVINTHSSLDAWIAGFLGRCIKKRVIRTRHLSTKIRKGINSRLLYNSFASHVVTTCAEIVPILQKQAHLPKERICSIPTGLDPSKVRVEPKEVTLLRKKFSFEEEDIIVGLVAIFRGWKGIADLLEAAKLLENKKKIKFLLVGNGVSEEYFRDLHKKLGLEKSVFFAGYLSPPFSAIAAMDIFTLLSWAHEGVSQASLQAAYLQKPLITTETGGLKEICIHEETGLIVQEHSPQGVADAIIRLSEDHDLRKRLGKSAKELVEREFLLEKMLDNMEKIYSPLSM